MSDGRSRLQGAGSRMSGAGVTLDNFMQAPHNRWAFQHIRELHPTRRVYRGDQPSSSLTRNPRDLDSVAFGLSDRTMDLPTWQQRAYADAMVVLHGGELIYEQYFNDQNASTPHQMFSVTKSWVAVAVLTAAHDGVIDLDREAVGYVPELAGSAFADATVQQLLDMNVGIKFDEEYEDPASEVHAYGRVFNIWGQTPGDYAGARTLHDYLPGVQGAGQHGEGFWYVTPVTDALAWILSRVRGQSISGIVESGIFQPLKPEQDAYFWLDCAGTEMAGAGLNVCARDAARFGQMILDQGQAGGQQVIPSAVAQRILEPRNRELFNRRYQDSWYDDVGFSYHDQWWTWNNPHRATSAMGIHGQHIYLDPVTGTVIVVQSSHPASDSDVHELDAPELFHALCCYLAGDGRVGMNSAT